MKTVQITPKERPPKDWTFNLLVGNYKNEIKRTMNEIKESFLKEDEPLRVCAISKDIDSITEFPTWCMKKRYRLLSSQHPFYLIEKTG